MLLNKSSEDQIKPNMSRDLGAYLLTLSGPEMEPRDVK